MSNFAQNKACKEKRQEREWERRKENAKYYRDLSKLSFGALVVGEFPLLKDGDVDLILLTVGVWSTFVFAYIGSRFLKL